MTSAGSDRWFGNALSGSDGTADPVVRHRPDQVYSDPTAAPAVTAPAAGHDPIVLPPLHLQANRAQIEQLIELDEPERPPRATPPPPPVSAPPPLRSTRPRSTPSRPATPPGPPPPAHQWSPPPPPSNRPTGNPPPGNHSWTNSSLPAPVNNFLSTLQQQMQQPTRPAPAPVKKSSSAISCFTVLFIIGMVLLVSGAGEQLLDLFDDLFNR